MHFRSLNSSFSQVLIVNTNGCFNPYYLEVALLRLDKRGINNQLWTPTVNLVVYFTECQLKLFTTNLF